MENSRRTHGPAFYGVVVHLMNCTPGNYDHAEGEPASIVTIARNHMIEPLIFSMGDTKTLVTKLLVVLATYEDKLARKLLDEHFGASDDGYFVWPDDSDDWSSYQT